MTPGRTPEIMHVETNLGLRPGGVETLGAVLLELGLADRLGATIADALHAPPFTEERDAAFGARNVPAAAALAVEQADRIEQILDHGRFPVVLGGDDTVLLGCLLALRRHASAGLVLFDGHTDYWDLPDGTGELSDSDLWIATGHGPAVIADLEGHRPLATPSACVVYGHRDRAQQLKDGSQDVYSEPMLVRSLAEIRAAGVEAAAAHAAAFLGATGVERVWLRKQGCPKSPQSPSRDRCASLGEVLGAIEAPAGGERRALGYFGEVLVEEDPGDELLA
jgi:arginase